MLKIGQDIKIYKDFPEILLPNVECTGTGDSRNCVLKEPTKIRLTYRDKSFKNIFKPDDANKHTQGGYCSYIVEDCGRGEPDYEKGE